MPAAPVILGGRGEGQMACLRAGTIRSVRRGAIKRDLLGGEVYIGEDQAVAFQHVA